MYLNMRLENFVLIFFYVDYKINLLTLLTSSLFSNLNKLNKRVIVSQHPMHKIKLFDI